jgi:hypothetical protein
LKDIQSNSEGDIIISSDNGLILFQGDLEMIYPFAGNYKKKWQGVG